MAATATATSSLHAKPPIESPSPSADWEQRCKDAGYTRWPHGLHARLFRATGGNATAIAICHEIAAQTHGAPERRGGAGRPEWTAPLYAEQFARQLGITERAVQDAMALLTSRELIATRPAANRAKSYQLRQWVWESSVAPRVAPAADEAKAPAAPCVRIVAQPLVLLPGKRTRPIPLDEVLGKFRNVRCDNQTGVSFSFEPVLDGADLCIHLTANEAGANEERIPAKNASPKDAQLVESNRKALASSLTYLLKRHWHKSLDPEFASLIADALGDTPIERFHHYALAEVAHAFARGRKPGSGLLKSLASQARKQWEAECVVDQPYIQRLTAIGCTESEAMERIARWRNAGWELESAIADAEASHLRWLESGSDLEQ